VPTIDPATIRYPRKAELAEAPPSSARREAGRPPAITRPPATSAPRWPSALRSGSGGCNGSQRPLAASPSTPALRRVRPAGSRRLEIATPASRRRDRSTRPRRPAAEESGDQRHPERYGSDATAATPELTTARDHTQALPQTSSERRSAKTATQSREGRRSPRGTPGVSHPPAMANRRPGAARESLPARCGCQEVEPQITLQRAQAIQIRERSVVMMRDQMQAAAYRPATAGPESRVNCTGYRKGAEKKNCAVRGRSVLVDASAALGRPSSRSTSLSASLSPGRLPGRCAAPASRRDRGRRAPLRFESPITFATSRRRSTAPEVVIDGVDPRRSSASGSRGPGATPGSAPARRSARAPAPVRRRKARGPDRFVHLDISRPRPRTTRRAPGLDQVRRRPRAMDPR